MLAIGAIVHVNFPDDSKQRVLHPARVIQHNATALVIQCDEPRLPLTADRPFRLYYELRMKFVQQGARVEAVLNEGELTPASDSPDAPRGATVAIKVLGDPASAESRECYRVSTLLANLKADLESEKQCVLADVSMAGFSIIGSTTHKPGSVLRVWLHHEGKAFAGQGLVQSMKDLGKGRIRYGLLCADPGSNPRTPLKLGLQQISMAVQRQQLKRLAGAA